MVLGVLSESSSEDGCGDRGTLFAPGEEVGDNALSMPDEACEDVSSSSTLSEGALSMLGEGALSMLGEEGGVATSTSECVNVGEGLGAVGDEIDDWFDPH